MSAKTRTQVELAADTSLERLLASQLSRVLVLVPPWLLVVLAVIAAAIFHAAWGGNCFAAAGIGTAGLGLSLLTWRVAHQRGQLGKWHAAGTAAATAAWVTSATADGVLKPVPLYLAVVGGITLALSWNVRVVIRHSGGQHGDGDHLAAAFASAAEPAGLAGSRLRIRSRSARVIEGTIALPPGEHTADDAVKRSALLRAAYGSLRPRRGQDRPSQASRSRCRWYPASGKTAAWCGTYSPGTTWRSTG